MGRLFDKMVAYVEAHNPQFVPLLHRVKLFELDVTPHEFLKDAYHCDPALFLLPFPVTAVEDRASVMVIEDRAPGAVGLDRTRRVLEFLCSGSDSSAFYDGVEVPLPEGDYAILVASTLRGAHVADNRFFGEVTVNGLWANGLECQADDRIIESSGRNVLALIEELMVIQRPSLFVVEKVPTRQRDKPKKIPRTHERPTYTMLTVGEFRRKTGLRGDSQGQGQGQGQHVEYRRAHLRRLSADGGHFKETRIVPVRAVLPKETEGRVGNKIYRLITTAFGEDHR